MHSYSRRKTALTCTGRPSTPSIVSQYKATNRNLRKSGSTIRHGTVIAPKQCLYHKEATGMESPKMYSSSRCKNRTYLCGTETTPSQVSQHRAENENLWKTGSTFRHGTVFALKQCLLLKEATVMESPKMHSSNRCKNRTYLVRDGKLPRFL